MQRIVVFGPGPVFKGGIANFTASLAMALYDAGAEVILVSWTQQYPAIIPRDFIDRSSKVDVFEGRAIRVEYLTNYNNPFSWRKTADFIASLSPDQVIFQWAIAIQGLPMGRISRRIKSINSKIRILFDVHNVVQKENGKLDRVLTRYALKSADSYVMHGQVTIDEFKEFLPEIEVQIGTPTVTGARQILRLYHPIYDMFHPDPSLNIEALKAELGLRKQVFLFFGFIRKYKGLHHTIDAFAQIASKHPEASLLIVGESFWDTVDKTTFVNRLKQSIFNIARFILLRKGDSEQAYRPLDRIAELGIANQTVVVNRFVPNEEVHRYFQVCDAVVNFYEYATPSGVESIAYNFLKPILATRVGHFAHAIQDGENGYLADVTSVKSMADAMGKLLEHPIEQQHIARIAQAMSWSNYANSILALGKNP
jgi:glycosyltransferase involved in cell wall biosynthesis